MKHLVCLWVLLGLLINRSESQSYFPPNNNSNWDTLSPYSLGWCQEGVDSLYALLDSNNTKAFILLKNGKIVLEKYFDGHTAGSNWYWASAGKTITAFMVGIAQQEGFLNIHDTSAHYLGSGWTNLASAQEEKITIRHQLTMTSGLDDGMGDPYCTLDTCLVYLADAGNRWAYHNAPYTLLDGVISSATGQGLNLYTATKLKTPIGMDGLFIPSGYNNVFYSTARSMARFGLLMQNNGVWNGAAIITDPVYFQDMINSSQNINLSYGYLWWLNGKSSYMIPQSQLVFPGFLCPNAPPDMYAAMGKNGQFINIVPSDSLVWVRMGNAPDEVPVPFLLNDLIWGKINELSCLTVSENLPKDAATTLSFFPNPSSKLFTLNTNSDDVFEVCVVDLLGRVVYQNKALVGGQQIDLSDCSSGVYHAQLKAQGLVHSVRLVKG